MATSARSVDGQRPEAQATTQDGSGAPPRPVTAAEMVDAAVSQWRHALAARAGASGLSDVALLGSGALDVTNAHPGGLAALYAGRATRLSNLIRDPHALASARRSARAIVSAWREQSERFGAAPTYLAVGVATWQQPLNQADASGDDLTALTVARDSAPAQDGTDDGGDWVELHAPVLLRPVTIRPRDFAGSDFDLTLEPGAEINPVVSRALRAQGALLDPAALALSTVDGEGFRPDVALDRIDSLGQAVFHSFHIDPRLLVGTFTHPGRALVDDLDDLAGLANHELVAALAGHTPSIEALRVQLPEPVAGDCPPALERGVGDLAPSARHVFDALATGSHVFVEAHMGADTAGLAAAIVAEAAGIGRSVLYVAGHRRAAIALEERLNALGLDGLVVDVPADPDWRATTSRRLLGAMTTDATPVDVAHIGQVRAELEAVREELTQIVSRLHAVRPPWGVSAYEALQSLVELMAHRPAPRTQVRLDLKSARLLDAAARADAAGALRRLALAGGLEPAALTSPWVGATLADHTEIENVLAAVDALLSDELVVVGEDIAAATADGSLGVPTTLGQWRDQLAILADLRATLDVFQPMVFENPPDLMIAATATREWREEHGYDLSRRERHHLVQRAQDMVRPGASVPDLHAALMVVARQRAQWLAQYPAGGWPRLPRGLAALEAHANQALASLAVVDRAVSTTSAGGGLANLPFDELVARLGALRAPRTDVVAIHERDVLSAGLRSRGLGPLMTDLAQRNVDVAAIADELELAWWSTVFDEIVSHDPYLARVDGARVERLAARFRATDSEHISLLIPPIASAVVRRVQDELDAHPDAADELFAELVDERIASLRAVFTRYGSLARRLRPVVVATPATVPQVIPPTRTTDLVVIDAVQHVAVDSLISTIARGRQVVVIGDPATASGDAIPTLAGLLPTVDLSADPSPRDPGLTLFLKDHGYPDVEDPWPLPSLAPRIHLDLVEGIGMPDPVTGAIEGTDAEVERVVAAVRAHAHARPERSLAIVALSALTASRIREALVTEARHDAVVADFLHPRRTEPTVAVDLAGAVGLHRDDVILAVSYGRTPHGRVLYRFGALAEPGGRELLLGALGVTRGDLRIISALNAATLDPERLRADGPRLLADVLAFAESYEGAGTLLTEPEESVQPNLLVVDLAERLYRAGLTVETAYGFRDGQRIPLVVGHPDLPGEMLVAVLTDDADYVSEPSVRVRDRQRAEQLERLGWTVIQVWSVALFIDPERQANRIRAAVAGIEAERRTGHRPAELSAWETVGTEAVELVTGMIPAVVPIVDDAPVVRAPEVAPAPAAEPVPEPTGFDVPTWAGPATGTVPVVPPAPVMQPAEPVSDTAVSEDSHAHLMVDVQDISQPQAAGPVFELTEHAALRSDAGAPAATPKQPSFEELVLGVGGGAVGGRPAVPVGLPARTYTDDQFEEVLRWLLATGAPRQEAALSELVCNSLEIRRRGQKTPAAVERAVHRFLMRSV